jgi:hypothetical protein
MSKNTEEEKNRWDQVMEQFDLVFTRVDDIGAVQQQMKAQMDIRAAAMDTYTAEQHLIAQQVQANGAAVAQLTMRRFAEEDQLDDNTSVSIIFDEEEHFENMFAKNKDMAKPESSKHRKPPLRHDNKEHRGAYRDRDTRYEHRDDARDKKSKLPSPAMPKMVFPKFDGTDPKIWKDNCASYFELY